VLAGLRVSSTLAGTGMWPRSLTKRFPLLPMEREGRLNDMPLLEHVIGRIAACCLWTAMLKSESALAA
jgi:hypothetical protein